MKPAPFAAAVEAGVATPSVCMGATPSALVSILLSTGSGEAHRNGGETASTTSVVTKQTQLNEMHC
jgi:hypothetical protein